MLTNSCADFTGLSLVILAQFTVQNVRRSQKLQKKLKLFIVEVQAHSGSSMLTPLKSSSLVLVMMHSSIYVRPYF